MSVQLLSREFLKLTTAQEAIETFRSRFSSPSGNVAKVELEHAIGRVLARDVSADESLPAWPRATVDGYAVAAQSVHGASTTQPTYLKLAGEVSMGKATTITINSGEAVRIPTGGMLPSGADSVVMIEHSCLLDERTVEISKSLAAGDGVNQPGEDFVAGQVLLKSGTRIRVQEVAVLAAAGIVAVPCRQLNVGILSTGDELVPPDAHPARGQVRDVNASVLLTLARQLGTSARSYGVFPDQKEAIRSGLVRALEENDVILISGGSSVGGADFTRDLIQSLGEPGVFVHGIAIKPGKPTIIGQSGTKAIFGLPGHPTSSTIVFTNIVTPCIHHLLGSRSAGWSVLARMSRSVRSVIGKDEYLKVRLTRDRDGYRAEPVFGQSANVFALALADGLVLVPLSTDGLAADELVEVQVMS